MKIEIEGTEAEVYAAMRRLVDRCAPKPVRGLVDPRLTVQIVVEDGKIAAIKEWREITKCSVEEARDAVEAIMQASIANNEIVCTGTGSGWGWVK